jgi:hypothetical protein
LTAGVTTRYELDNGRVLSADAAGNVTYYLYGLGPIGELTTDWNYSLPDGSNTPRQLPMPTVKSPLPPPTPPGATRSRPTEQAALRKVISAVLWMQPLD